MTPLTDFDVGRIADALAARLRPEDPAGIDRIAERVVELLRDGEHGELIDAAEVARRFGVTRDWVYQHKERLGVVYLGEGSKPRQRYRASVVSARLPGMRASTPPAAPTDAPRSKPRTPSRVTARDAGDLLPILGQRP